MPWKERTAEQMRKEFVERVLAGEKSKSALCKECGISRPTGDKWIKRCIEGYPLDDKSRRPHTNPNRTPPETEEKIIGYRIKYPAIGAVKIRKMMENEGYTELPSARTINNIFKRNGLITEEASRAATPYQRFVKEAPNDMWQADYKGHFLMGDGNRCHPLNIIDDFSRFNICSEAQLSETQAEIKPVIIRIFKEYGMPKTLLCDNGNPWGTGGRSGYSEFEVWLMELGILTLHGRIYHPQTQGKEESFNRSMKKELLKYNTFVDKSDAQRKFNEYREFYNNIRPHHALNLDTPAQHYCKSSRKYPDKISEWEYPKGYHLKHVNKDGYIKWNEKYYYLSEGFRKKNIAIRESHIENCVSLFFREFRIGRIDVKKEEFIFKRAYLIENDPREESRSKYRDIDFK